MFTIIACLIKIYRGFYLEIRLLWRLCRPAHVIYKLYIAVTFFLSFIMVLDTVACFGVNFSNFSYLNLTGVTRDLTAHQSRIFHNPKKAVT